MAGAAYAISFGNHLTMITLLPAFVYATFRGNPRVLTDWRVVAAVAGVILIGAGQYAYLFLRTKSDSLYLEYRISTVAEFIDFVSGERYRRSMFPFEARQLLLERLPGFVRQLMRDLGPLALVAPLGLALSPGPNRVAFGSVVLVLAGLGQLIWVLNYDIPDIEVYTIPMAMVVAVFVGQALMWVAADRFVWKKLFAFVLAAALALPMITLNQPSHAKSETFAREVQNQLETMGPRAVMVSRIHYSSRMAYVYYLYAEGRAWAKTMHLDYSASPGQVYRYLKGTPTLTDSHTRQTLPLGLRVFVDSRGVRENWAKAGLGVERRPHGLFELRLLKNP